MNIINLTPHALHFVIGENSITINPSGTIARCAQTDEAQAPVVFNDIEIPVSRTTMGEIQDLPEPKADTIYVVSRVIAEAAKPLGRKDLFIPGMAIRDEVGRIIGAKGLAVI